VYLRASGFIALTCLLLFPAHSSAQELDPYYLTLGAVLESDFEFAGDLNELEEEGSGYYLGAGKFLSNLLSFELAYTEANDYTNNIGQTSEVSMVELSGLARLKQEALVTPYVRLGLYHANADLNNSPGTDETGFLFGVGLDYEFSHGRSVRLDFTPGSVEGDDLNRLMIGLVVSINE